MPEMKSYDVEESGITMTAVMANQNRAADTK